MIFWIFYGCASLPHRWKACEQDYLVVFSSLVELREQGRLTHAEAMEIEKKLESLEELLIRLRLAAYTDDAEYFNAIHRQVRSCLKDLSTTMNRRKKRGQDNSPLTHSGVRAGDEIPALSRAACT